MSTELDELLASAREATRGAHDPERTQAMVDHALLAGRARHRRSRDRRLVLGGLGALALAAMVLLGLRLAAPPSAYELALPTGDRLFAQSDVRFEVESDEPALRRVRLHDGAMLFDVAPLEGGAFEVLTADETVRVLGTVFVVESSGSGTSVTVYEGRVEITSARGRRTLGAGERDRPELASARSAALEPAGREAAGRRAVRVASRASIELHAAPAVAHAASPVVESPAVPPPDPPTEPPAEVTPSSEDGRGRRSRRVLATAPSETDEPTAVTLEPALPEPAVPDVAPSDAPPATIAHEAREALVRGDAAGALALLEMGAHDDPAELLVEGDALRVLERFRSAARVYELVVDHPRAGADRAPAGYVAAELLSRRFGEHHHAREVLRRSGALEAPALEERALALDTELSAALGDVDAVAALARRYLERYPDGPRASWMRAHLGE